MPDNLPPLPLFPIAESKKLRWEYRGTAWKCERRCLKALINPERESTWYVCEAPTGGREDTHYLEAVPIKAVRDQPANYSGHCQKCRVIYEGTKAECKARKCRECAASDGPAKEPAAGGATGVEDCVCKDVLTPFRNVARGIPDNWPGDCILRFDQRADDSLFLSYYGVNDASNGITVDQWRKLLIAGVCGWQPIETAPRDGAKILAWQNGCIFAWWGEVSRDGRNGWAYNGLAHDRAWWYDECHPTQWMPLPDPPKNC